MTVKLCIKNKLGFCKSGDTCRCRHIDEKCVNPKFATILQIIDNVNLQPKYILENSDKIAELDKNITNLQKFTKVNDLTKEVERRVETSGNKVKILVQVIEEKDSNISELENKINSLEDKFAKKFEELEKSMKSIQENNESLKKSENKINVNIVTLLLL